MVKNDSAPPLPRDLGLGTWDLHVPPILTLRQWRMTEHKEVPPSSVPQGRRWLQVHSDIQRPRPRRNSPAGSRHSRASGRNPGCAPCGGGSCGVASPQWCSSRHPARFPVACRDPGRVVCHRRSFSQSDPVSFLFPKRSILRHKFYVRKT